MTREMTLRTKSLEIGYPLLEEGGGGVRCVVARLLLLVLLLPSIFLSELAYARTLDVPAGYTTIQSAVDAAENGDLVLVAPGTYFERVVISGKALTIASHFYVTGDADFIDQTVIDGFGRLSETSWEMGSNAVYIDRDPPGESNIVGLTLTNAANGVEVFGPLNVLYSKITGTLDALDLRAPAVVRGCTIFENGDEAVDFNTTSWGTVEYNHRPRAGLELDRDRSRVVRRQRDRQRGR